LASSFLAIIAMPPARLSTVFEAHALDAKTAKKIPQRMTGRTLTLDEAAALLDRLS
jgi:hypothetical protein